MCGIAGMFATRTASVIPETGRGRIDNALAAMQARGPDGCGVVETERGLIGHVRLAILDPAAGQQPMVHSPTGVTLSYNGELYNFRALRDELVAAGYSFSSNCDTDVILAAYLHWGVEFVDRCNGFFALAIYDPRDRTLILVRDRLGIKPLYYCDRGTQYVCFASSVAALLCLNATAPELDLPAVSHYLATSRVAMGARTLLRGVHIVPPGCWRRYRLDHGDVSERCYWRVPQYSPVSKPDIGFEASAEQVRALIDDAISIRLQSDVPVGGFLSGGIDSSIVALTATRHQRLPFFTAGTDVDRCNEFEFAAMMAANLNAELNQTVVTAATYCDTWNQLIHTTGLPLSTPNEISIYQLATALRRQATVALTGEGADEIFGGYSLPQFGAIDFERAARLPDEVDERCPLTAALRLQFGRAYFFNDTDHYLSSCVWFDFARKAALFQQSVWDGLDGDDELCAFYEDFLEERAECSAFDRRMHLFTRFNLESLLMRVDSSTMAASVEARVPFTDYRLVELAFSLPDTYKIDWRDSHCREQGNELTASQICEAQLVETKRLLRQAYRDRIPEAITARPKMSFPVPFSEWSSGPMREPIIELCLQSPLVADLFKRNELERLCHQGDPRLWLVANLCRWWPIVTTMSSAS